MEKLKDKRTKGQKDNEQSKKKQRKSQEDKNCEKDKEFTRGKLVSTQASEWSIGRSRKIREQKAKGKGEKGKAKHKRDTEGARMVQGRVAYSLRAFEEF